MSKIPVANTVSAAYRFVFGDLARLFGVAWLPLLLQLVGTLAIAALALRMVGDAGGNFPALPAELSRLNGVAWLANIAVFVLRTMLIFGLTEEALAPSPQRRWFYFSLSGRVWTLVLGYFLLSLILIGICIGIALVLGLSAVVTAMAAASGGRPTAHAVALLVLAGLAVGILVFAVLIYLTLRWIFLMAPVAVIESDIGLSRSWTMMRGNVGRGFAVCLAIVLPLALIGGAIFFVLFGEMLMAPMRELLHAGVAGAAGAQFESAMQAWALQLRGRAFALLPLTLVLGFVFGAIFHGLFAGASAYAYRMLAVDSPKPD